MCIMNKDELIRKVKALNLPERGYIVFGSGPLAAHGIREVNDIDLFISEEIYEKFKKEGWEEKTLETGDKYLVRGDIEAFADWGYREYNPSLEKLLDKADIIEGVPFAPMEEVLRWKLVFNREKDARDIELIKDKLSE